MNKKWVRILLISLGFFTPKLSADMIEDIEQLETKKELKAPQRAPSPTPIPSAPPAMLDVRPVVPVPERAPEVKRPAKAAAAKSSESGRQAPVHIKSDGQLTYARNGGMIHMTQNVVITQEELRFQSDEARVWLKEGNSENNIEKVECIGNVKVSKFSENPADKITARGERAFFYNDKRKVVLEGDARLWRGGHLIKGAQITYMLDDGMITVDRAEGIVHPEDKKPPVTPPAPTEKRKVK